MIATTLWALTTTVALLAIVDFLLTDSQKDVLSKLTLRIWYTLDEARGWSYKDWLYNRRASLWLACCTSLLIALGFVFYIAYMDPWSSQTESLDFGAQHRDWANTPSHLVKRYFEVLVISLTLIGLIIYPIRLFILWSLKAQARLIYSFLIAFFIYSGLLITAGMQGVNISDELLMALIIPTYPFLLIIVTIVVIVFAILVAYVASITLFIAEFIVRRIAEYPNGPVIGISVMLGLIITLLKGVSK